MKTKRRITKLAMAVVLLLSFVVFPLSACNNDPLDPKNPTSITIWHYYSGTIETAFNNMVNEFNETVGLDRGVIVKAVSKGQPADLEIEVRKSAKNEVGSDPLPDIFSAYADTAYEIELMGKLVDLGKYLSSQEQAEYVDSYIEEGKIGLNGELRIFPIAKTTEMLVFNHSDWLPFATATGYTYDDLATYEGLAEVASEYYEWSEGKALFGRDAMANLFIIAAKEFNQEIFQVSQGKGTINASEEVMRKIWDTYYVPYISGHFFASGKYRSENMKLGEIISYVGSTSSVGYTPSSIKIADSDDERSIENAVLPMPHFEGGAKVQVQQGAGMVVTKSDTKREYASVLFLKWFTEIENNTVFAAMNGYMPVKKVANNYESMTTIAAEKEIFIKPIADETLQLTLNALNSGTTLYTNKAFEGGASARTVLDTHLQDRANADRLAIIALIDGGMDYNQAIAQYNTTEKFQEWLTDFRAELNACID